MAALAFAQRLVRAPVTSTPEDIQRLLAASWSERDIIDLVVAAATVAFLTRINVGIEECGVALEKSSTE
jgi:uncharacterized protein YciW